MGPDEIGVTVDSSLLDCCIICTISNIGDGIRITNYLTTFHTLAKLEIQGSLATGGPAV